MYLPYFRYADEKHLLHQQLGAILVTVFTDAEGTNFIRFLAKLLPLMLKALKNAVESTDAISGVNFSLFKIAKMRSDRKNLEFSYFLLLLVNSKMKGFDDPVIKYLRKTKECRFILL